VKPPPPPAALIRAEEARRSALRDGIKRAVLGTFEIDREDARHAGRFAVRRAAVYRVVADELAIPMVNPALCLEVTSVVLSMGAVKAKVGNRRLFRGVRRIDECKAASAQRAVDMRRRNRGIGGKEGGSTRPYMDILETEGMPEELPAVGMIDEARLTLNSARIARATDAFWKLDQQRAIVRLYMEGASIREIEERTGIKRHAIHDRLHRLGLTDADNP